MLNLLTDVEYAVMQLQQRCPRAQFLWPDPTNFRLGPICKILSRPDQLVTRLKLNFQNTV